MRRWLKKWLPNPDTLHKDENLRWFGHWLHQHNYLWHINRQTIARGIAVGLLVAFIPLPLQMLFAAILAFLFRGNLPIAIVATWISNPITFIPINFFIYKTGVFITHSNGMNALSGLYDVQVDWSNLSLFFHTLMNWISSVGPAYFVGLIVISFSAAVLGYFLTHVVWNIYVRLKWHNRKKRSAR